MDVSLFDCRFGTGEIPVEFPKELPSEVPNFPDPYPTKYEVDMTIAQLLNHFEQECKLDIRTNEKSNSPCGLTHKDLSFPRDFSWGTLIISYR